MDKRLYVTKEIEILTGEEAKQALNQESDKKFYHQGRGVDKVTLQRWQIAQSYEKKTWMERALTASDDRNTDYVSAFNRYRDLRHLTFKNAIELGCGPFTNLRLIAWVCKIQQCTLLDPLAIEYLNHPHVFYNSKYLFRDSRFFFGRLARRRFLRGFFKVLPRGLFGKVAVREIIPKPIEMMPVHEKYDLIVMLNVLEHCYDIDSIFDRIRSIALKGAYFVFRDKYYDDAKVSQDVEVVYDAGHPLRVPKEMLDNFLQRNFQQVFREVVKVSFQFKGMDRSYEVLNYIGRFEG